MILNDLDKGRIIFLLIFLLLQIYNKTNCQKLEFLLIEKQINY